MVLKRMDNVLIVVEDLEAAKAFFIELGMTLEGQMVVEGPWVDRCIGIDNARSEIAMLRTPDGHGRIELDKFLAPAALPGEERNAPVNVMGIRRIMFAVDDLDGTLERLRRHGAELVDEVVQYGDSYRLCYVRGPEGILLGLAEELGGRESGSSQAKRARPGKRAGKAAVAAEKPGKKAKGKPGTAKPKRAKKRSRSGASR